MLGGPLSLDGFVQLGEGPSPMQRSVLLEEVSGEALLDGADADASALEEVDEVGEGEALVIRPQAGDADRFGLESLVAALAEFVEGIRGQRPRRRARWALGCGRAGG